MDRRQDPRTIVTPYAFSVHPDLMGMPLATPWQRLGAIAIDGVVIIGLSRIGGLTLAVASSLLLFWLAFRGPGQNVIGKLFRFAAGCMGVMVAAVATIVFFATHVVDEIRENPATQAAVREALDSAGIDLNLTTNTEGEAVDLTSIITAVPGILALQDAETAEEAQALMEEVARTARAGGMPLQDIRGALESLIPENAPWAPEGPNLVNEAMAPLRGGRTDEPEAAVEAASPITEPRALDSIRALNTLVQNLDEELQDAEEELGQARARIAETEEESLVDRGMGFLDDLGLGFGWAALYLTIAHALTKGSSVGKKMFRIRVVMIDLRPLTWWLSFERVGGYAAGLATGLLGFAQIFWDPNRQAIHDKVSETMVIQVGKDPVPGPWMAKGKAQWEGSHSQPPGVQN